MQDTPIIIKKHIIGLILIALGGSLAILWVVWLTGYLLSTHQLTQQSYALLAILFVAITLITIVSLYVYNLSSIVLSKDSVRVTNWRSLFNDSDATTEWRNIQDVTAKKTSIISLIFDYGLLTIQTAGTQDNLVLPMVPRVEYWRDYIEKLADEAKTPTTNA